MENQKPNFYDLYRNVGEISAKLDAQSVKLDSYISESKKCDDDIVCRVRALETNDSVKKGERAVIGGLAGIIGSAITMALSYFFGNK